MGDGLIAPAGMAALLGVAVIASVDGAAALPALADDLLEVRTIRHCGCKATMTLRADAAGAPVREGDQVRVEESGCVALYRKHFREALAGG